MNLMTIQSDFCAWLRDETGMEASYPAALSNGLEVYRNNYRSRLAACLEESFAVTRAWLGDDAFRHASAEHIACVPPSSWTLDAYSRDFPMSLHALYPDDPEVTEIAWLEWALGEAFVGADTPALDPAGLADVDWDRALLGFTPTLMVRNLATNATAIWSAVTAGSTPPGAQLLTEPAQLLVWRQEQTSRFRVLDQGEAQALALARSGTSFGDLCARIVAERGASEGVELAGAYLGRWLSDGLLCAVVVEPTMG